MIVFLFLIFFFNSGYCAGPISHAYLSEKFFEYFPNYSQEEQQAFRAGTLFPDIRYLGVISRETTHFASVTLKEILDEESPFLAGMKFHSFVDLKREAFAVQANIYSLIVVPHKAMFLKLIEDEIIYSKRNWYEWNKALLNINAEEMDWNIDLNALQKWHYYLEICFLIPPSSIISFVKNTNTRVLFKEISEIELSTWNNTLSQLAHSSDMIKYVQNLLNHFDRLMHEEAQNMVD